MFGHNRRFGVRWKGWNMFKLYDQNGNKESADQLIRVVIWLLWDVNFVSIFNEVIGIKFK